MKYLRVTVRYYTLPNAMVGIKIQWHKSMHHASSFYFIWEVKKISTRWENQLHMYKACFMKYL